MGSGGLEKECRAEAWVWGLLQKVKEKMGACWRLRQPEECP